MRRCQALGLQTLPSPTQIGDFDPKMMDCAAASIFWGLIVNMQSACPHCQKHISRASELFIKKHFCTEMPRPPLNGRFDIARKHMHVMKVHGLHQCLFWQLSVSALSQKADMCGARGHVCFGPEADIAPI